MNSLLSLVLFIDFAGEEKLHIIGNQDSTHAINWPLHGAVTTVSLWPESTVEADTKDNSQV